MANFIYRIDTHLLRPSSITNNITYQANSTSTPLAFSTASQTSVIASPFDGDSVNLNFFNIATAITDLTYQALVFQSYSNNAESTALGYVNYNGRREAESTFYGGSPLLLTGGTYFTTPYIMDNTNTKAFQVAAMNGIIYAAGVIDQVNSRYRPIVFGEAGQGSPFSTPSTLATYMNSRLKFNSNDGTNTFAIVGNADPLSGHDWTTLGVTPKSFWVWWNDGYTAYVNNLTTINATTGLISLTSTGVVVGAKVTINYAVSNTLSAVQAAINNSLTTAIGNSNTFSVAQNGSFLTLNISSNRFQNGVYQVTLQDDAADIGVGLLDWLGWLNSVPKTTNPETLPASTSEAYDYSSLFQFVPTGVGPYYLTINGVESFSSISFIDNYSSGTPLLFSFGLPTVTTTYYHTSHPATTYVKTLNYGGPFWASSLNSSGDAIIDGDLTVNGTITSTASSTQFSLPSYVSNSNFEFNTTNGIAPSSWVPYSNASASATPTSGGAASVYTYTVTFNSNPGGTLLINGETITVPSSLSTSIAIAQYLGVLVQAGYVFNYTGGSTFSISVSGPYANPTVVNGTLTSGMVSFAVSNSFGVPSNAVTILANNVSPLYGSFDAIISKPAANYQGQGYSIPFSIDRGATGQPIQVTFYYNTSANYVSGDLSVYVYDVTNANLIPTSIIGIPASPSASVFIATLYPSASLNYRFLFHIATVNATAWSFEFDLLSISPQNPLLTVMPAVSGITAFPCTLR